MRAKIIVIPVYQKHWLYQVWAETSGVDAKAERALHWTQGDTLHEKASLLSREIGSKINRAAQKQWRSLQSADEGTFKNRLFKLAQWVQSQEDPAETFLKSIPRGASTLEVVHPSGLTERLVRRRLRRMALAQEHFHNRRILGWALATLPQLPLVITPFPNVTLYYTAYKMLSHYQALQGCRTLRSAFERYDAEERRRASEAQVAGRGGIGGLRRLLALPRLGCGDGGSRDVAERQAPAACSASSPGPQSPGRVGPLPVFHASRSLDAVVRPLDRWHAPLPDDLALRVRDLFTPPPPKQPKSKTKAKTGGGGNEHGDGDDGSAGPRGGPEALPELVARLRRRVMEPGGTRTRR